jgi:sulfatase maturation enzyme AslB (radical SAM superfamily)
MVMLEVNVTKACPYECVNCIASTAEEPEEVFFEYLTKLIPEKKDIFIWLTGGEPMLFPDKVERYLKTGIYCHMVTTGLHNMDKLEYFLETYPTFRVNISVAGNIEYEDNHRKTKSSVDGQREAIHKLSRFKDRIMLVSVIFRDAVEGKLIDKNLDYLYTTFPQFRHVMMWDRFDLFPEEELLAMKATTELYSSITEIYCFPIRKMFPTLFVDGNNFRTYTKYSMGFVKIADCLADPLGIVETIQTNFNIGTIDTKQKCNVYKFFPGCGGPECRYGHNDSCEKYWSQFIV